MFPLVRRVPDPRLRFEVDEISDLLMPDLTASSGFGEDFADEDDLQIGGRGHAELGWWS